MSIKSLQVQLTRINNTINIILHFNKYFLESYSKSSFLKTAWKLESITSMESYKIGSIIQHKIRRYLVTDQTSKNSKPLNFCGQLKLLNKPF